MIASLYPILLLPYLRSSAFIGGSNALILVLGEKSTNSPRKSRRIVERHMMIGAFDFRKLNLGRARLHFSLDFRRDALAALAFHEQRGNLDTAPVREAIDAFSHR